MGSSVQFNLLAGFRAVDAWQQNLIRNAQGLLLNGYNKQNVRFGTTPGGNLNDAQQATAFSGGRGPTAAAGDSLTITNTGVTFEQGQLNPSQSPTALAIKGKGFFMVAENLRPGARIFLTRAGDFHYDAQGRLVNGQGLFVVGGNGTLTDPPQPVTDPGDGTVELPQLTLARVPVPDNLSISGYGATVYEANRATGPIQAFANGRPEVGFVQPNTLEFPSQIGTVNEIAVETNQAQQTYKMFKEMLDSYNRAVDDAIGTVK